MTEKIEKILESHILWAVARFLLSVVFLASGLAKLFDFEGGIAEMREAGLEPAILFNIAVIVTLLGACALLLANRTVWLACGALGVFLFLTIVVVHRFWAIEDADKAMLAMFFALEHVSLIGGLMAAAIAGHFHRKLKDW